MPVIISIVNQKGGTAKTTTTANLGATLATAGKRVLLIDLDPQSSLTYCLEKAGTKPCIADLLNDEASITEIIQQNWGVDLLPSTIDLADTELNLSRLPNRAQRLEEKIKPIAQQYDYVLIDCPPSLSVLTVNALTASHYVLATVQPEVLGIQGLELLSNTIEQVQKNLNSQLTLLGIVAVMVDKRRNITREVIDYIKNVLKMPVLDSHIRTDTRIIEAPSFGQPIISYAPRSAGSEDYKKLCTEILKLC